MEVYPMSLRDFRVLEYTNLVIPKARRLTRQESPRVSHRDTVVAHLLANFLIEPKWQGPIMAFQLLPAEECDVPDMVAIFHSSFASDPIGGRTMCNVPTNIRRAFDIEFFTKFFTTEKVYGVHVFKVVETETKWVFFWGQSHFMITEQQRMREILVLIQTLVNSFSKVVGFAKWHYPHRLKGEQQKTTAARSGPYPEGTNEPLLDDFSRQMWAKRDRWIDHEKTFCESIQTPQRFRDTCLEFYHTVVNEDSLTRPYNFFLFISFDGLQIYQCCCFRLYLYISLPFQQDPGIVSIRNFLLNSLFP